MSKRCAGFRHFGEVNYSYPRRVVHCDTATKTLTQARSLIVNLCPYLVHLKLIYFVVHQ